MPQVGDRNRENDTYSFPVALAPLPPHGTPESRRLAEKARFEGPDKEATQDFEQRYALYQHFNMFDYHQFVYLVLALERFELRRIPERQWLGDAAALGLARVDILNDVLQWFWRNITFDLDPLMGRMFGVSSRSP
jgi:hypothetical protein